MSSPQTAEAPAIAAQTAPDDTLQAQTDIHATVDHVEAESSDANSEAYDDASLNSSTTSIASSVLAYQYENGRRYHSYRAGQYLLPNDETEQDRLDLTHHLFRLVLSGELCVTKLQSPSRILDIGTGTGIWAMEIGDQFPSAEVVGTDLSPIQPTWVPPNVRFEIDDASGDWTFPDDHFDFVHARTLAGSIPDWPSLVRRCYKHLAPGGKVEIAEGRADTWIAHDSLPTDSFTYKWLMEWRRLSRPAKFDIFPELKGMLEQAGFTSVRTVEKIVPWGTWPKDKKLKEIGRIFRIQFLEMGIEAYTLALFARSGGWQDLEIKALLAQVKSELLQGKIHLYTFCSFAVGDKPA